MSNLLLYKSSESQTVDGANYADFLNPRCEQGNIKIQDVQLGCSSTSLFTGPGAVINVDSRGSSQTKAKNTRKVTRNDVKKMKAKVKDRYRRLQLPVVTWMRGANLSLEQYYFPLTTSSKHHAASCGMGDENDGSDHVDEEIESSDEEIGSSDEIEDSDECEEFSDESEDSDKDSGKIWKTLSNAGKFVAHAFRKVKFNRSVQSKTKLKNELENIFVAVRGTPSKRILVESQPGFGKTTLAHKIVHDWSLGKKYIRHFDLAVLVILKRLKERSLQDAVLEALGMEEYDDESVWNIVNKSSTLLLLDGLDEIGESARKNILKTVYDTHSNKMTIITTCRIGLFKLRCEERENLFKGTAVSDEFWDTKVKILGLTGKNRQRFVDKFVEDNLEKSKELKRINRALAPMKSMFKSPLLLILLIFVTRENPEYKSRKRTELFKNLVDCIVKRSIGEKLWCDLGQNFSLFQTEPRSYFHELLSKFGEISVANILADNLQFEHNDILDAVFRMGFLKKCESEYKLGSKVFYECFHLTFLEFAAAYSLWDKFIKNVNRFSPAMVMKINEILLKKGSTSMVLPFLCGLMGKHVEQFFLQFSDFCAMYSVEQRVMDSIFSECYLSEQSYDVVAKFIPKVYSIFNLSLGILTNQICMEHFSSVIVRFDELWKLTKKCCLIAKSLTVLIYDVLDILSELTESGQFKNVVKCDNLAIRMVYCLESYDQLAAQMKILFCVATDYKLLYLYKNTQMDLINKSVKNNVFKNQKVDYIECHSDDWNQNYIDTIINVIGHNVVKELVLNIIAIRDDHPIEALISVAASTSDPNSMAIHYPRGKGSQHELGLITSNGNKCWSHLSISEVNLTCNLPVTNLRINSLEVFGGAVTVNIDALQSFTPSELRLHYDLFHCAITTQKSSLWAGLKSIVDLTLILGGQTAPLRTLAELYRFKNLKRLQLSVSGLLSQEQQSENVDYLKDVVVDQLQLCWNSTKYSSIIKLITALNDLLGQSELNSVKNIDFMLEMDSEDELLVHTMSKDNCDCSLVEKISCFSALISVVKCDHKVTAHVMFDPYSNEGDKMLIFNFIDYSQVSVEQILKDVNFPYARNDFVEYAITPRYIILKIKKK